MGNWDWGLGIDEWELGPIPYPQSPIPNPHFNTYHTNKTNKLIPKYSIIYIYFIKINF